MADEPTRADAWLEMSHPKLPNALPVAVSRTAFERVWQPLGWQEATPDAEAAPDPDTVTAPDPGAATSTTDAAPRRKTAAAAASKED
ncbi:hypothetical protein [Streptomyces sp. NPDC048242]|uniref:hypothetical protein n=1 Tax=Streptomyces sp. NPDC048242 TaxID=3155026 RepID=UPI0034184D51